ncbi:MAG: hypothetical protein JWN76_2279 [Chitinophagaceae bacterium]|nr:hypothetical protein [Chitinophagaceae bacterium]
MNEDQPMSEQESLDIIQQMIHTAKREQKDDGKGWILWGWLLFLASLFTVINMHVALVKDMYFFWNIFGLLTIVLLVFNIIRHLFFKTARVKTYTSEVFQKLNIGFFISLIFIIVAINLHKCDPVTGFSLLTNLYGFWILIYGASLNFRPSIIAAFVVWAFAYGMLFTDSFELAMIFHGAAVLCGYIIPGHIANREFNKIKR